MKSLRTATSVAIVAAFLAGCGGHSTAPLPTAVSPSTQSERSTLPLSNSAITDRSQWKAMYGVLPAKIDPSALLAPASTTLPFYTRSIKSPLDGKTYTYDIAGADPHTSKVITNLMYVPIVLVIKFPGGAVLDPRNPGCGDSVAVRSLTYNGPNFRATPLTSNGVNVGTDQINDADMRAEFWSLVKGTGFHLKLKAVSAQVVIHVNAPSDALTDVGVCAGSGHDIGLIPIAEYDSMIRGIANTHSTSTEVPIFLTYNTFEFNGSQCCTLGYHSAYTHGGVEAYATAGWPDAGIFTGKSDIGPLTHEIGELMNDPFINNATPAWGHIGQVSGCQKNLEVGDPLSGTSFPLTFSGFTYHPQELVFFDWFFRTASEGTAGRYSFNGTLATTQGTCT